jgi:hypothetical protein
LVTETRPYDNSATQDERKAILRNDSYFSRQQNTPEDAGGRYAKLTPSNVIGSKPTPQYPQLPPSSPWANGFDVNVEPQLGYAVDEMPAQEIQSSEPALSPATLASPDAGDRTGGEEPVVGSTVVVLPSTGAPVIGSFARRRDW